MIQELGLIHQGLVLNEIVDDIGIPRSGTFDER